MGNVERGLLKAKGLLLTVILAVHTITASAKSGILGANALEQLENSWADYFFALIAFVILILFYLLNRPKSLNEFSASVNYPTKKQFKRKTNPHNNNRHSQ